MSETLERAVLYYFLSGLNDARLAEDLFTTETNRTIYREIREGRGRGETLDLLILVDRLRGRVREGEVLKLPDGVIKGGFAEGHFLEYIRQLVRRRDEREIKRRIVKQVEEPDFLPALKDILADYEPDAPPIGDQALAARVDGFREFREAKRSGKFWGHELPSFPRLTKALMGLREISVLSAKPKAGKSTLALQISSNVADQGAPVLYYDFENGAYNLMAREISRRQKIAFRDIFRGGNVYDDAQVNAELRRFQEAYRHFAIIQDRSLSVDKIRGHIRELKNLTGRADPLVVIDSLQKLPMANLRERRAAVDQWLRDFEALKAAEPLLSIILISELSREGQKPKESGDIEYTGHFLLELQTNRNGEEIDKLGDDNVRRLYIRAARDVEAPPTPITLEVNFGTWTITEEPDNRYDA